MKNLTTIKVTKAELLGWMYEGDFPATSVTEKNGKLVVETEGYDGDETHEWTMKDGTIEVLVDAEELKYFEELTDGDDWKFSAYDGLTCHTDPVVK